MDRRDRASRSIAADILRITLSVGIVVVVLATIFGVLGASRLASADVVAQQRAATQEVEEQAELHLAQAASVVETATTAVADAKNVDELDNALASAYEQSGDSLSRLVIVKPSGQVVDVYPTSSTATPTVPGSVWAKVGSASGNFIVEDPDRPGSVAVWVARSARNAAKENFVVLGELGPSFLDVVTADASKKLDGAAVLVLGPGNRIEAQAGPKLQIGDATWAAQSGGEVMMCLGPDGTRFRGVSDSVEGPSGLGWSVVVAQPMSVVASSTFRAVAPSVGVLLLGSIVAVGVAWGVGMRLSNPLRTLEEAAYQAAEGSYVKPLASDRDDEVGRLAEAFNAVGIRLNALHDISQLLASSANMDQVLDGILSAMGHNIGTGVTAVYLLDDSRQLLRPAKARGAQIDVLPSLPAVGETWVVEAMMAIEPRVMTGPPGRLAELLPGLAREDSREAVAIPLVSGYDALGVIIYVDDKERGFTEAETEMLRTFAAQAAVAVNNSRMFAEEAESREIAQALQSIAEELVAPGDLEEALESVVGRLKTLFDAKAILLAFADRGLLGLAPALDPERELSVLEMAARAFGVGDRAAPNAVPRGVDLDADELMDRHGSHELLIVPIALSTNHGAVLVAVMGPSGVRVRDVELADAVADEIALALDNAYLYQRALKRASNLETIFRISQALSSSLQFNIVLNRVLDVVEKIFSAESVWLMNFDRRSGSLKTEMARGVVSSEVLDALLQPGEDIPGYVFESGQPTSVMDIPADAEGIQGVARSLGLRSMLSVPLLARGRSIGVLTILSSDPKAFSEEDLGVLQTFAAQAALSIDTARLYSREHEVASILQRSVTPEALQSMPELESGSVYRPAGEETEIGGDYYDLVRAPDGSIVFAIGDVVGKGVVAATKTSMIKYAVRALVAAGLRPARVLREVNKLVEESGEVGDIVTLWLGSYDASRKTLTWANGGHPPALLLRGNGDVVGLSATGPLLGAILDVEFDEERVTLEPGDTVVLYTDGVTEARNGAEFFGEGRVREAVGRGGSCEDIVERLLAAVRVFAEGELRDDVAIVALRFKERHEAESARSERAAERREY